MEQDYEKAPEDVDMRSQAYIKKAAERMPNIGRKARSHPRPAVTACSSHMHSAPAAVQSAEHT